MSIGETTLIKIDFTNMRNMHGLFLIFGMLLCPYVTNRLLLIRLPSHDYTLISLGTAAI